MKKEMAAAKLALAKAKLAKDEDRIKECQAEIGRLAKAEVVEEEPVNKKGVKLATGAKPKTQDKEPAGKDKSNKPQRGEAGKNIRQCACGCGDQMYGKGYFTPGHDGRLTGVIKKAEGGEKVEMNPTAKRMYEQWKKAGRPGGSHPKLRDVAVQVMSK